MSRLIKFARLGRDERRLVIEGWTEVVAMRLATWTLPYRKVRAIVERRGAASAGAEVERPRSERIAWAVAAASAYVPGGSNCLVRALATETMLRRFGYDGKLKIGVAHAPDGQLRAHAWLESAGRPIIGDFELDKYVTLGDARVRNS